MEPCPNSLVILDLLPQKPPFRFLDEILSASADGVTAAYRFRENEFFFQGHFPGNPVTPGVILVESMAQAGLCAYAVFRALEQGKTKDQIQAMTMLFTLADSVEFLGVVRPRERVIIQGKTIHFRRNSIRSRVCMERENGEPVARGILTGTGVSS